MFIARKEEIFFLCLIAFLQGVNWTVLSSLSGAILVSQGGDLTPEEYGSLFIPFVIFGAISSNSSGFIGYFNGLKGCLQFGLFFHFLSSLTLSLSQLAHGKLGSFLLFFISQSFLGLAIGSTLTTINVYVNVYASMPVSRAIVLLYSFMTFGGAVFPLAFSFIQTWWILTSIISLFFLVLLILNFENKDILNYRHFKKEQPKISFSIRNLPLIFWLFLGSAFIYGINENTFSNWAILFLTDEAKLGFKTAEYGLSIFWGSFCFGQILISMIIKYINPVYVYVFLPIMTAFAFALVPKIHEFSTEAIVYLTAGIGCSAFFPLTVGLAEMIMSEYKEIISGFLVTLYFLGFGVSSLINGITQTSFARPFLASFIISANFSFIIFVLSLSILYLIKKNYTNYIDCKK